MKKACKRILGPLSDYLEGTAGETVCKMIEQHLKGCKNCRIHVDNMKMIITLYKSWRDEKIPKSLSVKLRKSLTSEFAGRKVGPRKHT